MNARKRGRPRTAVYPHEEQALLIASLPHTERAKAVRAMLIRVFVAYRRGEPAPAQQRPTLPDFTNPAEAARSDQHRKAMGTPWVNLAYGFVRRPALTTRL